MKTRWWIGSVAALSVVHAASAQEDLQELARQYFVQAAAAQQDPDGVAALRRAIALLEGKGPLRAEDRGAIEREMERLARLLHGSKPKDPAPRPTPTFDDVARRMMQETVGKVLREQQASLDEQVAKALAGARLELDIELKRAIEAQNKLRQALEDVTRLGSGENVGALRTGEAKAPRRGSLLGATVAPPAPPAPAAPPAVTAPLSEPPPAPLPPSGGLPTKVRIGTPAPPAAGSSPDEAELRAMLQELQKEMAEVRRLIDAVRSRTGR